MADTYTQLHIQIIFAVKYRAALIQNSWKQELHKYITGIVQKHDHKMLQINSVSDHIHLLVGLDPKQAVSTLVKYIKTDSSKWIKERGFCTSPFSWQAGFGAFSYSRSHVPAVIKYIANQENHHKKVKFLEEYHQLLNAFEIDYKKEYVFIEPI